MLKSHLQEKKAKSVSFTLSADGSVKSNYFNSNPHYLIEALKTEIKILNEQKNGAEIK
jgi:phosphoribosyl-dephospho-CoA transferase